MAVHLQPGAAGAVRCAAFSRDERSRYLALGMAAVAASKAQASELRNKTKKRSFLGGRSKSKVAFVTVFTVFEASERGRKAAMEAGVDGCHGYIQGTVHRVAKLGLHSDDVTAVDFDPLNVDIIASSSLDGTVLVWW